MGLPSLTYLEINGANDSKITGFDEDKVKIEINKPAAHTIMLSQVGDIAINTLVKIRIETYFEAS